jgi:hypothetical protein
LVLTADGPREFGFNDSREATIIGRHWSASHKYLETGDSSGIRKLRRKYVRDANGRRVRLLTDLDVLERLGGAGVLSFEEMYAKVA